MENITPMLQQYHKIKKQYPDCILFFRLGDFYEMFYEDAKKASGILDLVLTSRGAGKAGKIPMCGIPYHAADSYISRLIKAGLKVAICEQMEDPALAKGIVKRDVIRVITSGTFIDESTFEARYIVSINLDKKIIGIAFTDTVDGIIQVNQYSNINNCIEIISKIPVYEFIFPLSQEKTIKSLFNSLLKMKNITLSGCEDWLFNLEIAKKTLCEHFKVNNLNCFGIENMPIALTSAGALLEYLKQMNHQPMLHIDKISIYTDTDYVFISPSACYGLELDQLIKILDKTLTPMGKRVFKYWFYHPLKNKDAIIYRQEAIKILRNNPKIQQELEKILHNIPDIEKSISRISCGYGSVRDLLALRNTLLKIPQLQEILAPIEKKNSLFHIEDIPDIRKFLEESINPDVPISNPEGKIIKSGYNSKLDSIRDIQENGREWLRRMQEEEIKKTGINSLKIGYNQVFGYYIEISKPNLDLVPPHYIRKQTLVNAERFITTQLKEFEEKMVTAEEEILKIEGEILKEIYTKILENSSNLHKFSSSIAVIDVLYSLSLLSFSSGYTLPEITEDTEIIIKEGRHPLVEHSLNEPFVPNDTFLDCKENCLLIITGPNMSGKSTYIRQNAILVIMAQIGSFIPAKEGKIGIVDKIFTRIGAHDEISKGQSTFMVEMSETANILNNMSPRSLIILDEIGRGTSTYDGFSLAWAVAEYLQKYKVRTLFATHFHELTALSEKFLGVKNYNVAVKELNGEIVFLHKIMPGGADKSYGVYVAKIAGIPNKIIKRAEELLSQLEIQSNLKEKIINHINVSQLSLFSEETTNIIKEIEEEIKDEKEIKQEIETLDLNSITPLEALNKINEWKEKLKKKSLK